mgnify:CR=1 FL=1
MLPKCQGSMEAQHIGTMLGDFHMFQCINENLERFSNQSKFSFKPPEEVGTSTSCVDSTAWNLNA